MAAEALELVASIDWVEERRDELAGLVDLRSGEDISDEQRELQLVLAQAAGEIMEELPQVRPERTRRRQALNGSLLRLGANVVTQHQTRSFPVKYEPTMPDSVYDTGDRDQKDCFGCYARVVNIEEQVFRKRPLVPLFAGDLALREKVTEVNYIGIESGGDPYITPRPLDIDFSHAFRLVRTDGGGVFPRRYAGVRERVADLIDGLHALAASAIADPADRHLHTNPLLAFENL